MPVLLQHPLTAFPLTAAPADRFIS